jgi:hypothetical protein
MFLFELVKAGSSLLALYCCTCIDLLSSMHIFQMDGSKVGVVEMAMWISTIPSILRTRYERANSMHTSFLAVLVCDTH